MAEGATHVVHFDDIRRDAFNLVKDNTHVATSDNLRRAAFTLAEVLITLGIIGVVAAMTMPSLICKTEKVSGWWSGGGCSLWIISTGNMDYLHRNLTLEEWQNAVKNLLLGDG